MSQTVHVRDGRLATHAVRYAPGEELERLPLPYFAGSTTLLVAGGVGTSTRDTVDLTLMLGRRIAPWTTIIIAPRILSEIENAEEAATFGASFEVHDGKEWTEVSGMHVRASETCIVAMRTARQMPGTMCHEAWHSIERRLSSAWKDEIMECLGPLSYGHRAAYWRDPEERRARAFTAWCDRLIEGVSCRIDTRLDEIFALAWSGELGDALMPATTEAA